MMNPKVNIFIKTILATLIFTLAACGGSEYDEETYSSLTSTLSALKHGNANNSVYVEVDLNNLSRNGYMSPGSYPHVKKMLAAGTLKIKKLSDTRISLTLINSFNYCSSTTAIDTFAILGVTKCDYENNVLTVVLEK